MQAAWEGSRRRLAPDPRSATVVGCFAFVLPLYVIVHAAQLCSSAPATHATQRNGLSSEHNAVKHGAHALDDALGHELVHCSIDVLLGIELAHFRHHPLLCRHLTLFRYLHGTAAYLARQELSAWQIKNFLHPVKASLKCASTGSIDGTLSQRYNECM